MTTNERILKVLAEESCYLTFDELYRKAQPDCDWTSFADVLEGLVEQGKIRFTLPYGADTGCYGIAETYYADMNERGNPDCY